VARAHNLCAGMKKMSRRRLRPGSITWLFGNRPDVVKKTVTLNSCALFAVERMERRAPAAPFIGIRIKPLMMRSIADPRHLRNDCFVAGGRLPENFVVTLPKIGNSGVVSALCRGPLTCLSRPWLTSGSLKMEMMIETTQQPIINHGEPSTSVLTGAEVALRRTLWHLSDYTASCSITAAHQHMMHPA